MNVYFPLRTFIHSLVAYAFYWAAVIHCINGMWMFGNSAFYSGIEKETVYEEYENKEYPITTHDLKPTINWNDRAFGQKTSFLFSIFIILMIYLGFQVLHDVFLDYLGLRTFTDFIYYR